MRVLILPFLGAILFFAGETLGQNSPPAPAPVDNASAPTAPKNTAQENVNSEETADETAPETGGAEDGVSGPSSEPVHNIFKAPESSTETDPFVLEKKAKADEYFKRGVLLYEGEDFASAAEAFQVAYETLPHPAVLGNIAMCYDNAGKIPEAVSYYRKYFKDPVKSSKNEIMAERLHALDALVADLQISCTRTCEVRVDGIERGNTDARVVVMPGKHRVEGVVKSRVLVSNVITVGAKETKPITLELPPEEPEKKPVVAPSPVLVPVPVDKDKRLSPGFWFSSGMTVVSLSLVTAFGTMTLSQKNDYYDSGWTNEKTKERGERYRTITNAMIGLSGASAAAALLFAISDLSGKKKDRRVTVQPAVSTGAGIAIAF